MVKVSHRTGSYEVRFAEIETALQALPADVFVITDRHVQAAWGEALPPSARVHVIEPGEASKSVAEFERAVRWLAQYGADRKSKLLALGGGVVGDLGGYVAASYMRGIECIQVPTSLLAQVDSSVGGKVAIDLPEGKNLVGAFHPPSEVWICLETLRTLPWREFVNGMAEVWKYGFILDSELVRALRHLRLNAESAMLESVVRRCVQLKAEIVSDDEFDTTGARAILNFGHTVGHALEKACGYSGLLHGEAIAIGMVAESKIGERLGITPMGTAEDVEGCLRQEGLPVAHARLSEPATLQAMFADKKTENGRLAFSLLTQVGACKLVQDVPVEDVMAVLCL